MRVLTKLNKFEGIAMADVLLLNADMNPVTMLPLSVISWKEAIRYLVQEKITVLEWHKDWVVHSARWQTKVPSVVMLNEFQKRKTHLRYSKANVFLRDEYKCQYCSMTVSISKKTATIDHVLPVSHGGKSTWENSCCSCIQCNGRKGNDKKVKPAVLPHKPTYWELVEKRKKLDISVHHASWADYLE